MIRAVADTNILISALLFGGLPAVFLEVALSHTFEMITSQVLLDELDEKLRGKFEMPNATSAAIRAKLEANSVVVVPQIQLAVVQEDPDDDRVLECAVAGGASFIVTGDRHLLKIGNFEGIEIVRVREFLSVVSASV